MDKFKNQKWECDFRTHPKSSPLCGVLVESRDHPDLEYALRNFSCMLPYTALTILDSNSNHEKIMSIVGPDTNIKFIKLPEPFTRKEWIRSAYDPSFWEQFCDFEKILIFNVDTGIRHNSVLRFLHYDFIGAHFHHYPAGGDPAIFQGNGAFSIRNPKLCKRVGEVFRPPENVNEDDWVFVWHMHYKFNGILPTMQVCAQFSTEGADISGTMGFHDTERYTPGAWRVYELADGPSRKLINIVGADVDGRDVTDLVRLGVGPNGLRIFKETRLGPGNFLSIRTDTDQFRIKIGEEDIYIT